MPSYSPNQRSSIGSPSLMPSYSPVSMGQVLPCPVLGYALTQQLLQLLVSWSSDSVGDTGRRRRHGASLIRFLISSLP
jgi:hypothetical protein